MSAKNSAVAVTSNHGAQTKTTGSGFVTSMVPPETPIDRCAKCAHPIFAAESLRIGIGPRCRKVATEAAPGGAA